jgi:hypothetical protein
LKAWVRGKNKGKQVYLRGNFSILLSMAEYIINVAQIEEYQMLNDRKALDAIFRKANSTVVGGEVVALVRQTANGQSYRFEEITTQEDLNEYKKKVYKYVKED